jgi:hypothetical protein
MYTTPRSQARKRPAAFKGCNTAGGLVAKAARKK